MAKPELGLKRVCVACGTKFYDLQRAPAICPKCATEQPAEQPRLRRPGASAAADEKLKKRVAVVPDAESEEVELEDVEADETIEDAEELEDEAEGIDEAIEVEAERDEEG
ncbi:MAG: TIGR02300 family protein [Acetobacteraceae bacterium]|nr:TIGR02300 family protein [Acetobacteraceae bacterium]